MTFRACVLVAVMASGAACLLWGADPPLTDLRSQARKDFQAGNFRDAWELYRKLALDPRDDERLVGNDLKTGIDCLQRLAREDEVDAFREAVVGVHQKNWRLLQAAADSFIQGSRYGYLIAGQFFRGNHRGGGEAVSSFDQDRVRALQLMQQAMPLLKADPDHDAVGSFYLDLAQQFLDGREGGQAWKLQALTDLSKLPEYDLGNGFRWPGSGPGATVGAPVDADGNPVFYHVPARYASAKSDGERWRWALAQAAEFSPARRIAPRWLSPTFFNKQFGVQTLLPFGPLVRRRGRRSSRGERSFRRAHADGRRDHRPPGHRRQAVQASRRVQFPPHLPRDRRFGKQVAEAERALATLATIYENRRQYPAGRRAVARVHSPFRAGTSGRAAEAARPDRRQLGPLRADGRRSRPRRDARSASASATARGSSWKRTRSTSKNSSTT